MNTSLKFLVILVAVALVPTATAQADSFFKQRHQPRISCDALEDIADC